MTGKMNKLFPLILLLLICTVGATYIRIATDVTVPSMMDENHTDMNITLINSGDETAHDVGLSFITPDGMSSEDFFVGNLIPNTPFNSTVYVNLSDNMAPGRYNIVIITDYRDANNYPFSAVSVRPVMVKRSTISKLSCMISGPTIAENGNGDLKLVVRNLDNVPHNVRIRLFLPRELKIDNDEVRIELKPKDKKELKFRVENLAALPGSSYFVFASLDYEEETLHYSSIGTGIIKIVEEGTIQDSGAEIQLDPPFLFLVFIFIILLVIFLFFKFAKGDDEKEDFSSNTNTE